MKKFFKIGCGGIIALIVLIIIIAAIGDGDDATKEKDNTANTTQNDTNKEETPKEESKDGVLTEEKFAEITEGMTYEEVVAIVGAEGTVISETGVAGDPYHTIMYEFETDGILSSSTMMFQGGKLANKAQAGLGSSDIEITLEQFNQLQNGMTTEEVFQILGGEGDINSESGNTVMYTYNGTSLGGNASLMFQDGKLMNKSQFGLK